MSKLQPLVFLGASTAFQEISELINDLNRVQERYEIIAVLDDNTHLHGSDLGNVPVVGSLEMVHQYSEAQFVFGIGSYQTRLTRFEILKRLKLPDERFVALVHPGAKVYPNVKIGPGCIIHLGVVISNDVVLDPFSIVTFNAVVGPYSKIGRCAMVTTMAMVLSGVQIGACAFIGASSCLAERIKIGPGAMVGMATAVFRNVAPGAFVLGNPARVLYSVKVPADVLEGWETPGLPQLNAQDWRSEKWSLGNRRFS